MSSYRTKRNYRLTSFLTLLIFSAGGVYGNDLSESVKRIVHDNASNMLSTFKKFHQNPELGFQEFNTAATIAAHMKKQGYTVTEGVGGTGVVSILENGPGPVVLFRADMDALPIKERVDLDYASTITTENLAGKTVPVMHACGHDSHSAWLLGVATVMMELRDHWSGTLILVGQPAEELLSGAQAMVDDSLLAIMPEPAYIIAGHQMPIWPIGSVAINDGYHTAGSIQMDVVINGKGGHGSAPHLTIDPVVMGSQAVMAYQTIVSRMTDQGKPAVLTAGAFQSGFANNVISDNAVLQLNLRWYDASIRDGMVNGIKAVTDNIAKMYGVHSNRMPTYTIKSEVPPVFNDPILAHRARTAIKNILGEEQVLLFKTRRMGSEDFHMLAGKGSKAKVLMVEVGSGPRDVLAQMKAGNMPVYPHNPYFYMDPDTVLYGAKALSTVLLDLLESH